MMEPRFLGIDVSKATLDVASAPDGATWHVANTPAGIGPLLRRLKRQRPTLIVLEATGGYERAVVAACAAAGLPVVVANPRQIRDFAQSFSRPGRSSTSWPG